MVYDGPNDKAMLISELFGISSHKYVNSISTCGKSMFIVFNKLYKNENMASTDVKFEASIMYNKINSECKSWLDLTKNILMSPSHSNINCSWLITRKFGYYITLQFSYIEVKPMNVLV